ncbi:MAG: BMC domain-containing protein [Rhodothermales bacterium]|nr:BMC domain-containing protein [Rhodothermales bacterium]MBO6779593.1 BMC domain-containing protein [Rhodothermales bacterium]
MAGQEALGLVETRGLVAALEAADAAAKAARVKLIGVRKTNPALMTVQVVGETAAVRSAVDAARAAAERVGTVVSVHVIPRPSADVARMQGMDVTEQAAPKAPRRPSPRRTQPATLAAPPQSTSPATLESMTVRELRALARSTEGLPIKGREIARASKAELLKAFGR